MTALDSQFLLVASDSIELNSIVSEAFETEYGWILLLQIRLDHPEIMPVKSWIPKKDLETGLEI